MKRQVKRQATKQYDPKKQSASSKGRKPRAAAVAPTYVVKGSFPPQQADVRLVFRGLQGFAFDGTSGCQVGNFNAAPAGDKEHEFSLASWEKINGACPRRSRVYPTAGLTEISINVIDAIDDFDGTFVYQNPGPAAFSRMNYNFDHQDFRWTIDFEGDEFFHRPLAPDRTKLTPIVSINKGLFYTLYRTETLFDKRIEGASPQDPPQDLPFGYTAGIIGADIFLKSTGKVQVFFGINPTPVEFLKQANVTYQIDITNDCSSNANCRYDPRLKDDKDERSDFHLYYGLFSLQPGERELGLVIHDEPFDGEVKVTGLCPDGHGDTSDPAPCVGTGFGRSRTF